LQTRLDKLREYAILLRKIGKHSKKKYINDPLTHGNGERYLHLAAECALDIGSHIVARQKLGSPDNYREVFTKMGKAGILNSALTRQMEELAGLRNVLVHDYLGIDHAKTYDIIKKELSWIKDYTAAVEKFL
jgi:uncharacterized protein YutE (UPF0331/DUF86 family)